MYDANAFLLERYKYVLSRKQALNEATFKIAAIYQAVLLALALGQYNVMSLFEAGTTGADNAKLYSGFLLAMLVILSSLVLTLLAGGILAWFNYRQDESDIEYAVSGCAKAKISLLSVFSWYETYIVIIVLVVLIGWIYGMNKFIYPLML